MTLLQRVSGAFSESRMGSPENPTYPLTAATLLTWFGGHKGDAGVFVTETNSLTMPAVWRCVSLISSVAAALPLCVYRTSSREKVTSPLLENPHPELTSYELWRLSYVHRLLWGNAYFQKVKNGAGQVAQLWPLQPGQMKVTRLKPTDMNPSGKYFQYTDEWGTQHPLTTNEVLHIPGLGYDGVCGCSPIRTAAEGIGLALAAEKSGAKFFGSGNMMGGVLQTEQRLDRDQAEALQERWQAKISGVDNAHKVAILDAGASFTPIGVNNRDAQFLESRTFQISEISRMFGVPMYLLSETDKSTSWGTGLEQQAIGFVQYDLHPTWLKPTEARVTKELLGAGKYAEYDVNKIMRGASKDRAEFYNIMRQVGAYSANDIRAKENEPPVPGGDTYLQPLNMAPLGTIQDAPDPTTITEDNSNDNSEPGTSGPSAQ